MINFGNLTPVGTAAGLFLYHGGGTSGKLPVTISKVTSSEPNAVWAGDGIAAGLDLLHTGANFQGAFYLTMEEDRPGASIYMEKWLGSEHDYSPLQVWTSINWPTGQWTFRSKKGHLLQASSLVDGSSLIVGAYPEIISPDPTPKTPGQIWMSSSTPS